MEEFDMGAKTKVAGLVTSMALVGLSLNAFPARATPATVSKTFTVPGHSDVLVTSDSWCDNTGPHITLSSTVNLGGFSIELTFKNNVRGTHRILVVGAATLRLVDANSTNPQIWKQPPLGGAGGNPFIYYRDPAGAYWYLGRCVQDGKIGQLNHGRFSADFSVDAFSNATVQAINCSNKGSLLSVGTDSGTGDVSGRLVFSNSDLGLNPQHINDLEISASFGILLAAGTRIRKGGGVNGPGGNPLVSSQYGRGADVASFLAFANTNTDHGRCNKLY
jgi:hypothetical protein